jgi:hypothetical protein
MPKATKNLKRNVLEYEPKVRFDGSFKENICNRCRRKKKTKEKRLINNR